MEILKTVLLYLTPVVLALIAAPVGKVLANLITEMISKIKHESLSQAAWILVRAAESKYADGDDKHSYVLNRLYKKFPWASELKLEEFIKACVEEMKANLGNVDGSLIEPLEQLDGVRKT